MPHCWKSHVAAQMAIVPFKLWKEKRIQSPRLSPDHNVSATTSLEGDISSAIVNKDLPETENSQLYMCGQNLTAHQNA